MSQSNTSIPMAHVGRQRSEAAPGEPAERHLGDRRVSTGPHWLSPEHPITRHAYTFAGLMTTAATATAGFVANSVRQAMVPVCYNPGQLGRVIANHAAGEGLKAATGVAIVGATVLGAASAFHLASNYKWRRTRRRVREA